MDGVNSTYLELIRNQLNTDRAAGELKWFLFRAALFSYKRDFLLRPFPPSFRKQHSNNSSVSSPAENSEKDFDELIHVTTTMPPLCQLVDDNDLILNLSPEQLCLLSWVFDTEKQFTLKTLAKEDNEDVMKLTGGEQNATVSPLPDYVFRLEYEDEPETLFSERRSGKSTFFAYHGSKVANFHSILRNGLRANLNQVSLYGEGTYLSSELSVSLNWSPMSNLSIGSATPSPHSSADSLDGTRLSCIAVCEIIDDPSGVSKSNCTHGAPAAGNNMENGRFRAARPGSNNVPDRYVLVKNDDLLRVRYILAYVDRSSVSRQVERGSNICDRISGFCHRHRFWLLMIFYFMLLSAVGLANNSNFQFYVRRFWTTALNEYGYMDDDYPAGNFHRGYEDT